MTTTDILLILFLVFVLTGITVIFLWVVVKSERKHDRKFKDVLFPQIEIQVEKSEKEKKSKKSLTNSINTYLERKQYDKKITSAYLRAGMKDKSSRDFILDCFKYAAIGLGSIILLNLLIGNLFFSIVIGIVIMFYEPLNMYSKIKQREKEFMYDFPYFLQTIAFILRNGTNFSQAFSEATQKQNDSVLKEVMLDVLTLQTVNAGDYKVAFMSISDKIKVQEVLEFVNIVVDNIEKGVSVADIFLQQAGNMDTLEALNTKRKIKATSTKILFPILFMCLSLVLLLVNV